MPAELNSHSIRRSLAGVVRRLGAVLLGCVLLASACMVDEEGVDELFSSGECTVEDVLGEDEGTVVAAYLVENGQLSDICLGEADDVIVDSWDVVEAVAPDGVREAISLIAAIESAEGDDTFAFVSRLDVDRFVMAVDVLGVEDDPDQLALTIVHELSHVVTQTSDQIDPFVDPEDCDTFHNGDGCFFEDSIVIAWLERFWPLARLEDIVADGEPEISDGEDACAADEAYLGPYAASHPEEDLAESFAAFVLDVRVTDALEAKVAFFEDFPLLIEFRDRAADAGLAPFDGIFETCGS